MNTTIDLHLELDEDDASAVLTAVAQCLTKRKDRIEAQGDDDDEEAPGQAEELAPWDQKGVNALVKEASEADDEGRTLALLKHMARSDVAGETVRSRDVASALGIRTPSLAGVLGPLNKRAKNDYERPAPIQRRIRKVPKNGKRISLSFLTMDEDFAAMVREATAAQTPA